MCLHEINIEEEEEEESHALYSSGTKTQKPSPT